MIRYSVLVFFFFFSDEILIREYLFIRNKKNILDFLFSEFTLGATELECLV